MRPDPYVGLVGLALVGGLVGSAVWIGGSVAWWWFVDRRRR
jgi:hypothetical protein